MRHVLPVAASLLLPALSLAGPPNGAEPPYALDVRVALLGGGSSGLGTRTASGGLGIVDLDLVPSLRRGALELRAPLRFERGQAFGNDLTETIARGSLEPEWRVGDRVKLGAEAGVQRVWRLDWPDQYQPTSTGLASTDRYSYTALQAGANAHARLARGQHLRARWRVTSYDYEHDPAFDALQPDPTPTHLTPRDNVRNEVDLSWRYVQRAWALALRLDSAFRHDFVYPARRAVSGAAVAFAKQRLNDYEPSAELELRSKTVEVSLELGWAMRDDTFEGYYSYAGPHPRARVRWSATRSLSLAADAQGWWLRYGPDSRNPVANEDGKRRYDHRVRLGGQARYALDRHLAFLAEASWVGRTTNYPDYVPPGAEIDWDYENTRAVAGFEWRR
jgi:hypothetical protein